MQPTGNAAIQGAFLKAIKKDRIFSMARAIKHLLEQASKEINTNLLYLEDQLHNRSILEADLGNEETGFAYKGPAYDVLYLIQLLCIGPNAEAQSYFSGDGNMQDGINIMSEVVQFTHFLDTQLNRALKLQATPIFDLAIESFRALQALIYGPHSDNQKQIVGAAMSEVINRVLSKLSYSTVVPVHALDPKKTDLKLAMLRMLHIALEGDTVNRDNTKSVFRNIQWQDVMMQMNSTLRTLKKKEGALDEDQEVTQIPIIPLETSKTTKWNVVQSTFLTDTTGTGFEIFDKEKLSDEHHLYASLVDKVVREVPESKSGSLQKQFIADASESREYANLKSKSVEIMRDGKLEILSFRPPDVCTDFTSEFLLKVENSLLYFEETEESTMNKMLVGMKKVAFDCLIKEKAQESSPLASWYMRNEHHLESAVMWLSVFLNVHVLLFFNTLHDDLDVEPTWPGSSGRDGSGAQTTFVEWSDPQGGTVLYHLLNASVDDLFDGSMVHARIHMVLALMHIMISIFKAWAFIRLAAPLAAFEIFIEQHPERRNIVDPDGIDSASVHLLLYSPIAWYKLLHNFCSVGGLLISPAFYSFFLVDLFTGSKTIHLVMKATYSCLDKLLWLIGLMVLVIYWYATVAHMLFWNQQAHYQRTCSTLFQCFLSYTNEGMKNNGISGLVRDVAGVDTYPTSLFHNGDILANVFMDLSFFILVIFVLAAILNGVIVDTFGEMRDAGDVDAARLRDECFICGLVSDDFKPTRIDLETHRIADHNIINYIFLVMTLQRKNDSVALSVPGPRLWTAQELFVADSLTMGDTEFFPRKDTLAVQAALAEEENDDTDGIQGEVEKLLEKQSEFDDKLEDVMSILNQLSGHLLPRSQTASPVPPGLP